MAFDEIYTNFESDMMQMIYEEVGLIWQRQTLSFLNVFSTTLLLLWMYDELEG